MSKGSMHCVVQESRDDNVVMHNGSEQNVRCELLEDRDHLFLIYAHKTHSKIPDQEQTHKARLLNLVKLSHTISPQGRKHTRLEM